MLNKGFDKRVVLNPGKGLPVGTGWQAKNLKPEDAWGSVLWGSPTCDNLAMANLQSFCYRRMFLVLRRFQESSSLAAIASPCCNDSKTDRTSVLASFESVVCFIPSLLRRWCHSRMGPTWLSPRNTMNNFMDPQERVRTSTVPLRTAIYGGPFELKFYPHGNLA